MAGVFLRTYLLHSTYIFFCTRAMISVFIVKPTVETLGQNRNLFPAVEEKSLLEVKSAGRDGIGVGGRGEFQVNPGIVEFVLAPSHRNIYQCTFSFFSIDGRV